MFAEDKEDHSKRPEDTNFKQQRLKAWQPLLTPPYVIGTFFVIGIIFIPIGAVIYSSSMNVVEVTARYDNLCPLGQGGCVVTVNFDKDMSGPVYFYYRMTNFYQNHRRYVESRSDDQLAGTAVSSTSACDPLTSDDNNVGLYPCGLIANSFFNDTFTFQIATSGGSGGTYTTLAADETNISWESDRKKKFIDAGTANGIPWSVAGTSLTRNLSVSPITGQPRAIGLNSAGFLDPTTTPPSLGIADEHFIVWMRTAGLPTFKKLWARFANGFSAGDSVKVIINNQFPTAAFNGQKAVVFSTTSWLGGKNDFLGIAYLVVGILCILLGVVFWIKHCVSPRPLGDMQYLNWPGSSSSARS